MSKNQPSTPAGKHSEKERKRLEVLKSYNIIDADLEEELNGLTRLASELCETPISLINLIGTSRQITKSSEGWAMKEMPREYSLCDYTIQKNGLLEINDIETDSRFQDNPLTQIEPDIRFYAGVPLTSPEGYALGALCVIDKKPRSLTKDQKDNLQLLSKEVMSRLQRYRETQQLRRNNEKLKKVSLFLDDSSDIQMIIEPESLQIQDIFSETAKLLGGKKADYIGSPFGTRITNEQIRETIKDFLSQTSRKYRQLYAPIRTSKGDKRYFELTFSLHGGLWYLTARDQTEKISFEKDLQKRSDAIEASLDGIAILNEGGNFQYINESHAQMFGYKNTQRLIGKNWTKLYKDKTVQKLEQEVLPILEEEESWRGESKGLRKDGSEFPVELSLSLTSDDGVIAIIRDITERKETEQKLKETLHNLEHAQELAKLANWKWVIGSDRMTWSKENYTIYGYDPETTEPTMENYFNIVHPDDIENVQNIVAQIRAGDQPKSLRHRIITPDGKLKHLHLRAVSYTSKENGSDILFGTTQDITEQVQIEKQLRKSLSEKEVLLAEIHHRVKNNLAVISGLLQLEALQTEEEQLRHMLNKSQMRIHSMATIHENLYQHGDFSHIPFHLYIQDLLTAIQNTFEDKSKNITINMSLDEVTLNINQAVPCGLIVNELIVNAFKHAFVEKKEGEIFIALSQNNDDIILKVKDNGIGLPKNFNLPEKNSLGITLIQTLCKQINASLDIQSRNGACFEVQFKKTETKGSSGTLRFEKLQI